MTREPFLVHCGACAHEWAPGFLPMPVDLLVRVGKSRCPACDANTVLIGPLPRSTPDGDAVGWLMNGDTGTSSKTIWRVMMRRGTGDGAGEWDDVPHDPADFGRCHRLLQVMPSWRARLPEVAAKFPEWKPLVDDWDNLTELYEAELPTGMAPKLYERMRQLRAPAWARHAPKEAS